jgi:hypothetical protein
MEMVSECINARFKFKARMQVRQNRRMASYRVVKLTPAKTGHLDRRGPPPRRLVYRLPSGIGLFQVGMLEGHLLTAPNRVDRAQLHRAKNPGPGTFEGS